MTIAEIHGKLAPDQPNGCNDRMEDLLTSDVFGTMRYAGWDCGFLNWLHEAEVPVSSGIERPLRNIVQASNIQNIHLAFWPMLLNQREPDVAILVIDHHQNALLILVEAKYFSGTSDFEVPDEGDDVGRTGNQIADQILGLSTLEPATIASWFALDEQPSVTERLHVFVTKDALLPTPVYQAAARHLPFPWPRPAYWLSWTTLAQHLRQHLTGPNSGRAALVRDLLLLLERKGLVPYRGFDRSGRFVASVHPTFWNERWWRTRVFAPTGGPGFWR